MRLLPVILLVVLAIYCWVEIAQSDPKQVRELSRGIWALVVIVPLLGPVAWLVYGRPNGQEVQRAPVRIKQKKTRPVAPDDDPEFLRSLRHRQPPEDPPR